MRRNRLNLAPAVLFAFAAVLFGASAGAADAPAVKALYLVAALCELAAGLGFFCSYWKGRQSPAKTK